MPGAGNPQAFDRYAYVLGNPLRYSDPSGHGCYYNGNYILDTSACNWIGQGSSTNTSSSTNWNVKRRQVYRSATICGEACENSYRWRKTLNQGVTKPLQSWSDISGSENRDVEVGARLLLAEMGNHLNSNKNWQEEGTGILWTVRNRVNWMRNQPEPKSWFTGCSNFFNCATAPGQYATTTTSRGLDPLYLDPLQMETRTSYYGSLNAFEVAVEHATLIAISVVVSGASDPTGGARYFSHDDNGNAIFSIQIDVLNESKTKLLSTHKRVIYTVPFEPFP